MDKTRSLGLRLLSLAPLLLFLACASGPPPGPSRAELAGAKARTIIISPFNVVSSLPVELEGSTRRVKRILVDYLEARGKTVKVMGRRAGTDLWHASMKEVSDTGQRKNFENAAKIYARKIGEHLEVDAVIVPSVFVQNAKARSGMARWDGAEQKMEIAGRIKGNFLFTGQQGTLNVRAASLFVQILDRTGNEIHTERSGIELIQHLRLNSEAEAGHSSRVEHTWETVNDVPAIEDEERIREAIVRALVPFIPEEPPASESEASEAEPAST